MRDELELAEGTGRSAGVVVSADYFGSCPRDT